MNVNLFPALCAFNQIKISNSLVIGIHIFFVVLITILSASTSQVRKIPIKDHQDNDSMGIKIAKGKILYRYL